MRRKLRIEPEPELETVIILTIATRTRQSWVEILLVGVTLILCFQQHFNFKFFVD